MENFWVSNERVGSNSKRCTTMLVVCLIALPLLLVVTMMYHYQQSTLEFFRGFPRVTVSDGKTHNFSIIDSKNDSFQPPSNTTENEEHHEILASNCSQESGSRNDSSNPSNVPSDKLLHGSPINDKFVNGLLAPGFDEESCLSRYQSFLYRKNSPHKPSSYLLSMLRNYEALHKSCGPSTGSYNKTIKSLASGHRFNETSCKYVVWIPANGLGNRMVSMASSFLYALLTNRVLLVYHEPGMTGLFCEPFPNTSWLLPMQFPLKHTFGSSKFRRAHSIGSFIKNDNMNTSSISFPSFLYLNLDHSDYNRDIKLFYCDQSQAILRNIPWLVLLSDQYFAPSFFMISSFREEVSKMFPVKDTVFHHLGRYLFHPANEVWGLITRFYDAYLANADQRIGLQIRVFNPKTTPVKTIMDQLLSCALEEKLLPHVDAQKFAASMSENRTSKAVLVTSLQSEYYENLSNMYWTKSTMTGEVVGVYQPSHEEYQHFQDNMHNIKAWAEINLLSLTNVLITSAWSTFGYVAQSLGGLKPWILYKTNDQNVPSPPCQRDVSMEPCFHFPPTYDCKTKMKFDAGALVPYLRHCEDFNSGVKLIGDS